MGRRRNIKTVQGDVDLSKGPWWGIVESDRFYLIALWHHEESKHMYVLFYVFSGKELVDTPISRMAIAYNDPMRSIESKAVQSLCFAIASKAITPYSVRDTVMGFVDLVRIARQEGDERIIDAKKYELGGDNVYHSFEWADRMDSRGKPKSNRRVGRPKKSGGSVRKNNKTRRK